MNIIIFGAPGAGKGTQSDYISKKYGFFKLSSGELLRKEINKKSKLGNEIAKIINSGSLVSNEIINSLIKEIVSNKEFSNKIIFDGYPRNIFQAESLKNLLTQYNQKISLAIKLKVGFETIKKRITGRVVCKKCGNTYNIFFNPPNPNSHCCKKDLLEKREDDTLEVATKRFDTYQKKTEPVLEFYKKLGLLKEVNGESPIDEICKEISGIISLIEA